MATQTEPNRTDPATSDDAVPVRLRELQLNPTERRISAPRRRWGRWLAGLLLLIAAGSGVEGYKRYQASASTQLREVDTFVLGSSQAGDTILDVNGYIVPHTRIKISPKVGGDILEFPVEIGMKVKKGDILARTDDTPYRASCSEAKATLALFKSKLSELTNGARSEEVEQTRALLQQAENNLELMKKNRDRAVDLLSRGQGAITEANMDRVIAEMIDAEANVANMKQKLLLLENGARTEQIDAAKAEVERAEAILAKADHFLEDTQIESPIDGTVLEKMGEAGESVHPELVMTSLLVIADLSNMEAEVDVPEQDLTRVKIGQPCRVIPDAYSERVYEARLDRMQPIVSRQRGVVQAKVKILDSDDHLLVDMNCRVQFLRSPDDVTDENKLLIPTRAVKEEGGETFVFVLEGDVARRRKVKLGKPEADEAEVQEGLAKGDIIILPGSEPLADGTRVQPRRKATSSSTT